MSSKEKKYTPLPQDQSSPLYSEPHSFPSRPLKRNFSILIATLLIIISIQVILLIHLATTLRSTSKLLLSPNGLDTTRLTPLTSYRPSPYKSPNTSISDPAWSRIRTGHGVVALSQSYIASHSLPASFTFPGDKTKSAYVLESYHALHCVKMLRVHYLSLLRQDPYPKPWNWSRAHDEHCFDALRQYVMCNWDDTLLASTGHRDAGHNQQKMCRDWDVLSKWAGERERRAGYRDGWDMVPHGEFGSKDIWGHEDEDEGEGDGLSWD